MLLRADRPHFGVLRLRHLAPHFGCTSRNHEIILSSLQILGSKSMTFVSQWQTSIGKFGKVNLRIAESRTRVYLDINGKIFPGGTLPSGAADFDPTQPFNGVEPIGEGINRGQNGAPFSPDIASSYSSAPDSLGTEYFILNDGRALTR